MNLTRRKLSLAVLLAGVLLGVAGASWAQQSSPMLLPQPGSTKRQAPQPQPLVAPSPPVQVLPAPSAIQVPEPSQPQAAPAQVREPTIRDIAVEASDAPNQGNPTGRQEPGVGLEW